MARHEPPGAIHQRPATARALLPQNLHHPRRHAEYPAASRRPGMVRRANRRRAIHPLPTLSRADHLRPTCPLRHLRPGKPARSRHTRLFHRAGKRLVQLPGQGRMGLLPRPMARQPEIHDGAGVRRKGRPENRARMEMLRRRPAPGQPAKWRVRGFQLRTHWLAQEGL